MLNQKIISKLKHNILDLFSLLEHRLFKYNVQYFNHLISSIQKVATNFFTKILDEIELFRSNPIVKLYLKNIIIGSLCLIVTKLLIGEYLNIFSRIGLLVFYTCVAAFWDIRENIKDSIIRILYFFLGDEFIQVDYWGDVTKEDHEYSYIPIHNQDRSKNTKLPIIIFKIMFEIKWFFHYLCQQVYIYINGCRLLIDSNFKTYFIIYYGIIIVIILYKKAIIISLVGLLLILSKLFIYIRENNYNIVLNLWTIEGYNPKLKTKRLKFCYKNYLIFTFWNINDVWIERDSLYSEVKGINIQLEKYFFEQIFYKDIETLPFEFYNDNNKIDPPAPPPAVFVTMIPALKKIAQESNEKIINIHIGRGKKSKLNMRDPKNELKIKIQDHDMHCETVEIQKPSGELIYENRYSTLTSGHQGKYLPKNAEIIAQHTNNKETSISALAPLYKERFNDKDIAINAAKNSLSEDPKIKGLDLKKFEPNFSKDMFFDFTSTKVGRRTNLQNILIKGESKEVPGTTLGINAKLHNDLIENRPINLIMRELRDSKNNCINDMENLAKEIPNNNLNIAMKSLKETKNNMHKSIVEAAKLYKKERMDKRENIKVEFSTHSNSIEKGIKEKKELREEQAVKNSTNRNIDE